MNAAELAILKDIVDKELPALIAAEEGRLPLAYQPLVAAVVGAIVPGLMAKLDAALAAIVPTP